MTSHSRTLTGLTPGARTTSGSRRPTRATNARDLPGGARGARDVRSCRSSSTSTTTRGELQRRHARRVPRGVPQRRRRGHARTGRRFRVRRARPAGRDGKACRGARRRGNRRWRRADSRRGAREHRLRRSRPVARSSSSRRSPPRRSQHIGFGDDLNSALWAIFSTGATGGPSRRALQRRQWHQHRRRRSRDRGSVHPTGTASIGVRPGRLLDRRHRVATHTTNYTATLRPIASDGCARRCLDSRSTGST